MFIKEKVARLYVEVAKRQWPGEWDDMDLFLKQMFFKDVSYISYTKHRYAAQIVIVFIKGLAYVTDYQGSLLNKAFRSRISCHRKPRERWPF